MTLKDLKESVEDGTFKPKSMILVGEDKFIPLQYIQALRDKFSVTYIEDLSSLVNDVEDIFFAPDSVSTDLIVYNTEVVDFFNDVLYTKDNIIVVAKKIDKEAKKFYADLVIEIPKLVDWQIKDMVYSFGQGADTKLLDWITYNCGGDVNRLYNELSKVVQFSPNERKHLLSEMIEDGAFDDISNNTIFNFTNAIINRDIKSVGLMMDRISTMDISEFGLMSILYTNFMNIVQIQLGVNPSVEKLGMKPNQFNAIKHNCGKYTSSQLVEIVRFLSELDLKIKSGELPTNILIDYILTSILSF